MTDLIRGKIYDNIMQTIGNTPLVRFPKITKGVPADLCYKLEFFNPVASVKDRIGIAMIETLEAPAAPLSSQHPAIRALQSPLRPRPKGINVSSLCPSKCRLSAGK